MPIQVAVGGNPAIDRAGCQPLAEQPGARASKVTAVHRPNVAHRRRHYPVSNRIPKTRLTPSGSTGSIRRWRASRPSCRERPLRVWQRDRTRAAFGLTAGQQALYATGRLVLVARCRDSARWDDTTRSQCLIRHRRDARPAGPPPGQPPAPGQLGESLEFSIR
jgi:hypothetical protein